MRSKSILSAWLITLAACSATLAEQDVPVADRDLFSRLDKDRNGQLTAEDFAADQSRLFARLLRNGDADGNGGLTPQEWQQASSPRRPAKPLEKKQSAEIPGADAARLLLLKLDTDENGTLTKDEAPASLAKVFKDLAQRYDRNDDNRISSLELARGGPQIARLAPRVARQMDWNVDKQLARYDREQGDKAQRFTERQSPQKMLANKDRMMEFFTEFDGNKDGKLELNELPEQARDRFGRLFRLGDRNRDGALDKREYTVATQRAARFMRMTSGADKP